MNIRMSTKGKRPMRSLTPSDKIHAIQRIHDGESKASVARDIGVPESTLRGWCKNEDKLRFMSRQSSADKLSTDAMAEKLDGVSALLGSPPEKRQKMDTSLPLNFSNKLKYDELSYKRSSLNGLDFSTSKALADLNFNGLAADYASFNGTAKHKGYGADVPRQNDPSMAAISPLSSLSHLSGLTGLSHSPLAISFNELTSNLNLLVQLNPGLAAMSGLNGLASTANQLLNVKPKAATQIPSPRSEGSDRQHGLSVKNWAKQKPPTSTTNEHSFGLNLTQSDVKSKIKCPSPSLAPSLGHNMPISSLPDDPLLYWLKSQQAMLGLYPPPPPPPPIGATSPPIRTSTPQQNPLASTSLTPSTPSGGLDDKNSTWFNWCKAFGASLNSLAPMAVTAMHPLHQPVTSTAMENSSTTNPASVQKPPFENILYSHLTKDSASSPSVQSSSSAENLHNNEITSNTHSGGKPEDLSAKSTKTTSPTSSPTPAQSPAANPQTPSSDRSATHSPEIRSEAGVATATHDEHEEGGVADCKDMLDHLLYKINDNRENNSPRSSANAVAAQAVSESSCNSDSLHNNNDLSTNNNNNNSNKTDEEERSRSVAHNDSVSEDLEAIQHGEKFLKWLENCSNPRVTAMQLMQLKCLLSAIKSSTECEQKACSSDCKSVPETTTNGIEESPEDCSRTKLRRRK